MNSTVFTTSSDDSGNMNQAFMSAGMCVGGIRGQQQKQGCGRQFVRRFCNLFQVKKNYYGFALPDKHTHKPLTVCKCVKGICQQIAANIIFLFALAVLRTYHQLPRQLNNPGRKEGSAVICNLGHCLQAVTHLVAIWCASGSLYPEDLVLYS